MKTKLASLAAVLIAANSHANEVKVNAQLAWVHSNTDVQWMRSWLRDGTGLTRYDHLDDGVKVNHIAIEGKFDLSDEAELNITAIHSPDSEKTLGISEAFVSYKPFSDGLRQHWRVGAFYPNMSFENPDIAWNNPYTYSFSAINSWIAEEFRILGAEYKLSRPGRKYNSPHSFDFVASAYVNNDPVGTIISWRGWALHNKQTVLGERVQFANYPSLTNFLENQPSWVEPIEEIDDTIGVYAGIHWKYKNNSEVRYYHFDNLADGTKRIEDGQYAWRTVFDSIAWQYRFDKRNRFMLQWMDGNTNMGKGKAVNVDYTAWYALFSHKMDNHRFSVRYDNFETVDIDANQQTDPNDSNGDAWTLAWRYQLNENYQIGLEWLQLDSVNESRQQWQWAQQQKQRQLQFVLDFRY